MFNLIVLTLMLAQTIAQTGSKTKKTAKSGSLSTV